MQIQSVDALKTWLTSRLEPICDADPAALAKYVVALVKKDKPITELKDVCVDQLEVFLSNNTNEFVDTLFEALSNNSYMPTNTAERAATPITVVLPQQQEPIHQSSVLEEPAKVNTEPLIVDDDDRDFKRTRKAADTIDKSNSNIVPSSADNRYRKRRLDDESGRNDRAKVLRDDHRRRADLGHQSEGNDDLDRDVRHKIDTSIRDRWHEPRDGNHFDGRNRRGGPLWSRHGDKNEKNFKGGRERFGGAGRHVPPGIRRQRCRDYDEKGFCMRGELCPYDHGNDPVVVEDVAIQGMLGFPAGPPPFLPERPPLPMQPPGVPRNMGPVPPGVFPAPSQQPPPPGSTPIAASKTDSEPPDGNQPPSSAAGSSSGPSSAPKPSPPVIIPPQIVASAPHALPPGVGRGIRPIIPSSIHSERPGITIPRLPFEDSYNPEQPQFERLPVWQRLGNRPPAPFPHTPYNPTHLNPRSRALINVPPGQNLLPPEVQSAGPITSPVQAPSPQPEKPPVEVVAGAVGHGNVLDSQKKQSPQPRGHTGNHSTGAPRFQRTETLELKKIPRELNTISKLNEYFQRFGNIINIQVCAFGDQEAALIKFSKHEEARAAHSCPEAVLGNRFIRVYWHNPDRDQSQQGGSKAGEKSNKPNPLKEQNERHKASSKVIPTMFQSGKTTFVKKAVPNKATATTASTTAPVPTSVTTTTSVTPAATPSVTPSSISSSKTASATNKQTMQQKQKEIMKKKLEIQKQKQLLLNKQIQQQKLLIENLEKKNIKAAEKETILKTIKSLNANIETLKKEVEIAAIAAKSKDSPTQARQLAQKAILDQELELITHQQTGEDTTELKHTVEQLKQEAQALGLLDPSPAGRGSVRSRGSWVKSRGRGRGHTRGRGGNTRLSWTRENAVIDKRSRQICVADVATDKKEDVIEHFMEFGNVDRVEHDKEKGNLVLTFRTRKEAEIALTQGVKHKSKNYSLSWYNPQPVPSSPRTPTAPTVMPEKRSKSESDFDLDLEAELGKLEGDEKDTDEVLLLGDFDEEEDDEDDRSWRR